MIFFIWVKNEFSAKFIKANNSFCKAQLRMGGMRSIFSKTRKGIRKGLRKQANYGKDACNKLTNSIKF